MNYDVTHASNYNHCLQLLQNELGISMLGNDQVHAVLYSLCIAILQSYFGFYCIFLYSCNHLVNCFLDEKKTKRRRLSKLTAIEMLDKKNKKKAEAREKELELRQRELDFNRMKFETESEERRERFRLECEEHKTMLELLKKHL